MSVEVCCDLCGSDEPIFLLEENGFRVCRCGSCSLTYVNPQPDLELGQDMGHFEADNDWSAEAARAAGEAVNIHQQALEGLARALSATGRLLDIGCGFGHFLAYAREAGWEAHGIDVSEYALAYARQELGLKNLRKCDFLQSGLPEGSFDAVTLLNALEHVPSPKQTLLEAWRVLRPGGVLLVRVPNMDFSRLVWPARSSLKLAGIHWSYLMSPPPQHLYGFDPRTLRRIFEASGFETLSVEPSLIRIGQYRRIAWHVGLAARAAAVSTRLAFQMSGGRWNLAATIYGYARKPAL